MLALLHGAEPFSNLADGIGDHGAWCAEDVLLNKLQGFVENAVECIPAIFEKGLVVDESERGALAEWPHVEAHVVGDVAQTDLDEGAEGCETAPGGPQELSGQGVQDAVDAASAGDSTDALLGRLRLASIVNEGNQSG